MNTFDSLCNVRLKTSFILLQLVIKKVFYEKKFSFISEDTLLYSFELNVLELAL